MITENLSTLKIHKLTQAQYDNAVSSGAVNENELYLTPYEEIDLTPYATIEQLNDLDSKVGTEPVSTQINNAIANKSDISHKHQAESLCPGNLEFHPGSSAGHGGYIDFHYNDSAKDYTSRIIESNGILSVEGNFRPTNSVILVSGETYGDTLPNPGTPGRIFFLKASE